MGTFQPYFGLLSHIGCCWPPYSSWNFSSDVLDSILLPSPLPLYPSLVHLLGASSSKVCLLDASIFQTLHRVTFSYTFSLSHFIHTNLYTLHLLLSLQSLEQSLRHQRCVIHSVSSSTLTLGVHHCLTPPLLCNKIAFSNHHKISSNHFLIGCLISKQSKFILKFQL